MPKNLEPLKARSEGIRKSLVSGFEAGKGAPNEVIGTERELFVKKYLEAAYPRPHRFSSGFIIDSHGSKSGQLDIVVERVNSLSLPAQSHSSERLFFSEMVSVVVSVKSNFHSQWSQLESEINKISELTIEQSAFFYVGKTPDYIPVFLFSYSGAKTTDVILEKLESAKICLRCVFIADESIFFTRTERHEWIHYKGESAFLMFIAELHKSIATTVQIGENIWNYVCESEEK